MATLSLAPAPEAAPLSFSVGKFTFAVQKGVTVPTDIPKDPRHNELPFKQWFGAAEHNDHLFVPSTYWTASKADGGRELDPAKVTVAYQKTKLRDAFNGWRKKDEATRAKWNLVTVARNKGDCNGDYTEPGISMFLVDSTRS